MAKLKNRHKHKAFRFSVFQHDEKMGPFPGTIEKCPFSALLRFLCRQNHWNAESLFRSVQDSSVQLDRTASGPALML